MFGLESNFLFPFGLLISQQEYYTIPISIRFYSVIAPGDTVNVIGEFDDQGNCEVDHDNNLLIVHPDILVSGTRVIQLLLTKMMLSVFHNCECAGHCLQIFILI